VTRGRFAAAGAIWSRLVSVEGFGRPNLVLKSPEDVQQEI